MATRRTAADDRPRPGLTRPDRADLPVLGQPPTERADAARSRRALLAAARAMVAESGIASLSMAEVADRAGVGVGTVYRRFGDLSGLALALLDNEEQRFQGAFIFGPPPLGPGAPPLMRLRAFMHAYLDRLEVEAELHTVAELRSPTTRHRSAPYRTAHTHLVTLLRQAEVGADPDYLADTLLALLAGGLYIHHRRERGLSAAEIKAAMDQILDRLLTP
ncbi:MAG: helix-turn-helix transcriptional regulator [Pseudonocardia sp.]|nr:helix-turn-helix transcriptional regulator [Pseudonocardia sp.]MBO0873586.1 helix-turn-helix transcriptional regulator [Pseudonocardia sp.]